MDDEIFRRLTGGFGMIGVVRGGHGVRESPLFREVAKLGRSKFESSIASDAVDVVVW